MQHGPAIANQAPHRHRQAKSGTYRGREPPHARHTCLELGPLTETHKQVVTALEVAGVEAFVQVWPGLPGRPPCDRAALARAFVAKAVIGLPTTSMLIERLKVDKQLRRLCGWERRGELCSEATFLRAFAEFARSELPSRVHEALIKRTHEDRLVGHISRGLQYHCGLAGPNGIRQLRPHMMPLKNLNLLASFCK